MNHLEAREVVRQGYRLAMGVTADPPLPVLQALQGVCWLETQYGQGWKGPGKGSNNWGAVQGGRPPCVPGKSFTYTDTHPNADGSSTPYSICFKTYATPAEGAADVARIMFRAKSTGERPALQAAMRGDLYGVSAAMHAQGYYEGFGRTVADRIRHHYEALLGAVKRAATTIGEPMPDGSQPPPPTIRKGSFGAPVKEWQRVLNRDLQHTDPLVVDGHFGPITQERTKVWQGAHGLLADGVVGPKTWKAASHQDVEETAGNA